MKEDKKGINVLHIDDEPGFLALTKLYLEMANENFSVDTSTSAKEGLELLRDGKYDVIVTDYKMQGMDGLDILQNLRERGNAIPFIMLTGRGREEVAMEALNKGANHYLQKGGNMENVFGALARVINDEVEKKRAEDKVVDSEKRLADIINFLPDATFAIDREGKVIAWNHAIENMTDVKSDEIQGKGNYEYAIPFYGKRRPILVDLVLNPNEDIEGEYTFVRKEENCIIAEVTILLNGRKVCLWGKASPIHDTRGVVIGAIESIRDITERKDAEDERERLLKELEVKNAEMERFVYTISHELRSPLVTVQGFVGMLQKDADQNEREKVETDLKIISNAVANMEHLLKDTLELSRIGRVVNPPEDVSFGDIVNEALEQRAEHILPNGVEVSVAENFPTVHVDRMRIVEVLTNLIENSIKFMRENPHPKIDIGYRIESEEPVFFVKDNGIGLDKSQHEKVFGLFYRGDKDSKGTGAGLAIVKRIIEMHGGRVWIESEQAKGCTVCFTLPAQ